MSKKSMKKKNTGMTCPTCKRDNWWHNFHESELHDIECKCGWSITVKEMNDLARRDAETIGVSNDNS